MEETTIEETITLSKKGMKVLTKFFSIFDKDGDGLLSEEEIEEAFSIVVSGNPFSKIGKMYLNMAETEDDKLTLNGWISLWW